MVWKKVGRFPNYSVSSDGQVRNRRGLVLKPEITGKGYLRVELHRSGKARKVRVHRLVLEAFRGECPAGMETRHLNGNKADNRIENLVYGTPLENLRDSVRLGIIPRAGKLTERSVRVIRRSTKPAHRLAKRFRVSVWTVNQVRRRSAWKGVI